MSEETTNLYDFKLILLGLDELTPKITDKLYEAGLDDANLCSRKGVVTADFDREAESFEHAVLSAMDDVRRADVGVTGFRLENQDVAVSLAEVARRIGKTRQAVSLYATGQRGRGAFPRAVTDNNGEPMYSWAEVADWLEMNGMLPAELAREAESRRLVHQGLEYNHGRLRRVEGHEILDAIVRQADLSSRS